MIGTTLKHILFYKVAHLQQDNLYNNKINLFNQYESIVSIDTT